MNEQQAIALVQKTFKSAFDRSGYIHFLKNLLNEFDDEGSRSNQGARISEKFQNHVQRMERVGKYTVDEQEVMLFIVYLKNNTSIERARTMQRNFVASYLQKDMKDAALVAFVSNDPANWRFSFIKMEYRYDEENNKIREEFTPAKRWSFLVGTNEASHTAQRQFKEILQDDVNNPTLEQLEAAFNIEKVTNDFFKEYRRLFIETKEALDKAVEAEPVTQSDFEAKGVDTVNLAKKLLGQIIFLYYLQKKGWFGVARNAAWGNGSRNFLRELFDKKHGDYKNFFNDILEPLFYDALRRDRSEDDHYYPKFNCKIPFLNGGLFDPMNNYDWVNTDILLPNELFHNKTKTKEGDEGDGILDIFDRYNFTVKEDEPFEKEVAIDPELLGKAYEKFNAIRPDNYDEFLKALKSDKKGDESKFNKQYGVYYTPREIVHYMCQQSLINYLSAENSEKGIENSYPTKDDFATLILKGEQIKEHDERVVAEGRETATYSFQMPESIRNHAALIDEKLANIKVCDPAVGSGAFPVGMMSEIVRARDVLRSWTKTIKTLYDFKRGCIENSLYGVDIDSGAVEIAKLRLWLSLVVDEDDIQHIKPLPNLDYKVVQGNSLVGLPEGIFLDLDIKAKLEEQKKRYFYLTNSSEKNKARDEINILFSQLVESAKQFDPTLGNIKFDFHTHFSEVFHEESGFDVVIGNPPYVQIKGIPAQDRRFYEQKYEFATGRFNIFYLFIEKTKNIARKKGIASYIIPDRILLNTQCDSLRKWLLNDNQILEIVSFDEQVFETAVVDSIILSFENSQRKLDYISAKTKASPLNLIEKQSIDIPYVYINLSPSAQFDLNFNHNKYRIIQKIMSKSVSLETIAESKDGIIQGKVEDKLFITKRIDKDSKPLLFGENVEKYKISFGNYWVNYKPKELMALEIKRRGEGVRPGLWMRDPHIFERPKILTRQTADEIIAAFDDSNYYHANTLHGTAIFDNNYHSYYVLGILNSKVTTWFYRSNTDEEGKTFAQIKIELLRRLPVPKIDEPSQKPIIKLVERILAAKAKNPQADISKLEEEIDELVYQLYGLTEEEKNLVKGK